MNVGQINMNHELGQVIYDMVSKEDIKNIVEIGTWNGAGSTQCIYKSIKETNKKDYNVISLEANVDMFNIANSIDEYKTLPKFNLLLGRIIKKSEVIDLDSIPNNFFNIYSKQMHEKWLNEDLCNYDKVPNVLEKLPLNIDLLILDGGEFSTYAEFLKLKDRAAIIILDDINCIKGYNILKYIQFYK
jgi:hypothetical protein